MIRYFELNNEGIAAGTEFVRKYLGRKGVREKEQAKAVLTAEESLADLAAHSSGQGKMSVYVRSFPGTPTAVFSARGPEYEFKAKQDDELTANWDEQP